MLRFSLGFFSLCFSFLLFVSSPVFSVFLCFSPFFISFWILLAFSFTISPFFFDFFILLFSIFFLFVSYSPYIVCYIKLPITIDWPLYIIFTWSGVCILPCLFHFTVASHHCTWREAFYARVRSFVYAAALLFCAVPLAR